MECLNNVIMKPIRIYCSYSTWLVFEAKLTKTGMTWSDPVFICKGMQDLVVNLVYRRVDRKHCTRRIKGLNTYLTRPSFVLIPITARFIRYIDNSSYLT